jgi:hypothetical protein
LPSLIFEEKKSVEADYSKKIPSIVKVQASASNITIKT